MRLLITGASGLLGLNLALEALKANHCVTGWINTRELKHAPFEVKAVNLLELDSLEQQIEKARPDCIIHCAAVANLEAAEANPDLAYRINTLASGEIARIAANFAIRLVHISTDAVFDGIKGDYTEEDEPVPLNTYARSKLAAEWAVAEANPDAIIARVNFYGWSLSGKRSLAEFFFNNLIAGTPINGFTDVYFCPLYVQHLSATLLEMVKKRLSGLYHVVSQQPISKYEFGLSIAKKFGFGEDLITPISVQVSGLEAVRSPNLKLSTEKLQAALGYQLPSQPEALEGFYHAWQAGLPEKLQAML